MASMTAEERKARRAEREAAGVQMRGQHQRRQWMQALGLAAPFLIITLASVAIAVIVYVDYGLDVNQAAPRAAKTVLLHAVTAAEAFAVNHENSFATMTTDALKRLEPRIEWVNGHPADGQVGINITGERTFTLVYKNLSGTEFKVKRNDQGTAKYTDSHGAPI